MACSEPDRAWPLPPHVQLRDFLPASAHQELLSWVRTQPAIFSTAKVIGEATESKGVVDPSIRVALTSSEIGPLRSALEVHFWSSIPVLEQALGMRLNDVSVELELAAHGNGAHYQAHLDIAVGEGRRTVGAAPGEDRVLSAVYYFYSEPKAFSGGELRLYSLDVRSASSLENAKYIDLAPLQNSLVAFPSWAMHEVRPISCPSESWPDYRFALNCWYCRKL
jgi:SM-20-related protein